MVGCVRPGSELPTRRYFGFDSEDWSALMVDAAWRLQLDSNPVEIGCRYVLLAE